MERLGAVVCLAVLLACDGAALAGAGAQEKGCDRAEGACAGAEAAAEVDPTVHPVAIDGAPIAIVEGGKLRAASARESADATLTVVVFSDYQCPYCARGDATVKALAREYGPRMRVVIKQLPLPMHAHARDAALAALAAGEQGRYWEMHEKLFANARALEAANLERYAQELGLDVARFKQAMADPALARQIEADQAEAASLGVRGTPAFFVNGRLLVGAQPLEEFRKLAAEVTR